MTSMSGFPSVLNIATFTQFEFSKWIEMTQHRRLATLAALLLLATTLVACQNGKVGGRCKAGTVAQDATHVLVCKKGKWSRLISKADGMRELARIQAEEAARAQPPATQPPSTEPPATAPPATEPPATDRKSVV